MSTENIALLVSFQGKNGKSLDQSCPKYYFIFKRMVSPRTKAYNTGF